MRDDAPQDLSIRAAEGADADAVADLMAELGYPTSSEKAADRIRVFSDSPGHVMLLGEVDGSVVGLMAGYVAERVDRVGRYGVVSALVVTEAQRRSGIGRRLTSYFEDWAVGQGAGFVRVTTRLSRTEDAHRFYPAIGYEKTGYRFERRLT